MSDFKIVADSSSDIENIDGVDFASVPLRIITNEKEYVDDKNLDVRKMVEDLFRYKGKSSTSCPNTADWLTAFGDAKYVFCITITATLSGSYNSARIAKEIYEEKFPDRKVFVFNSLSTGPEMKLIAEKIAEMIKCGLSFEEICEKIPEYSKKTGLLFVVESMKNLANNGRVNPLVVSAAGLLSIRAVGKASDKGDLEMIDKCRGEKRTVESIITNIKSLGFKGGKIKISHCFNEKIAFSLKQLLSKEFKRLQIEVYNCKGLCGFYAEKGGLLIGFEK